LCTQLFAIRAVPAPKVAALVGDNVRETVPPRTIRRPPTPVAIPQAAVPESRCPSCGAGIPLAATACASCGCIVQNDDAPLEAEGATNLCPNPACAVANPLGERSCQRCGSPLPSAPGTIVADRYRIEKLLAIGGFAVVYLATDTKGQNQGVAVKEMICTDPQEFATRLGFFEREADILQSLASLPIVPRSFDLIKKGASAYLVLEYIRGQDLLKVMESNGNKPFPLERVIDWGKSICDVLAHMHGRTPPLVHRDLKPDNIMLLGDGRTIKMIDFGTARGVGRSQKTRLATKTRVYTEGYAPPEQIIGRPEPRSDLFALAGTLYHLATGKPPEGFYTARDLQTQLAQPNGSLLADQRWFYELLSINLSEDVHDRYFSCKEFKIDLENRSVTRQVLCPNCHAANKVREPFCCRCAAPMTDLTAPCSSCAKANRMGSRCCIHCGNRLR
jgi:serine/threonine-protein kinase